MKILNEFETIQKIASGWSFSKMCDGELIYIFTGNHYYVDDYEDLREVMKSALTETSEGFFTGLPPSYFNLDYSPPARHACWKHLRKKFSHQIDPLLTRGFYGSCFISRMEQTPHVNTPEYWKEVKKIWTDRKVIGIRGAHFSFQDYQGLFPKMTEISTLSVNCWAEKDKIIGSVLAHPKDTLVVLSCGVSAAGLAYLLWQEGYQAVDVGRIGRAYLDGSYNGYKKTYKKGYPW